MNFEPQMLHVNAIIADRDLDATGDPKSAEAFLKMRMSRMLAEKLADLIVSVPGGAILSPVTYTVQEDGSLGASRVAATVNYLRLPDPEEGTFYLYGGRLSGHSVRVGAIPPRVFRIPYVPPVTVFFDGGDGGPGSLILEYHLIPGTTGYEFYREDTL